MIRRRPSLVILALCALLQAQPLCWGQEADRAGLFETLDALALERASAEASAARLARFGSPGAVLGLLRQGRPVASPTAGRTELRVRDDYGRGTDLTVIVPKGPPPAQGYGLLMLLHGLGGNGRQLLSLFEQIAEERGFIIAAPTAKRLDIGRDGNEDTFGIEPLPQWWSYRKGGFALATLRMARRRFPIDPGRVVLSGYSMGGYGTWNLGLRYPDRFAGLLPMAGSISRIEKFGMTDARSRSVVPNGASVPLFVVHGERDRTVPIESDRACCALLEKLGGKVDFRVVEGGGHQLGRWLSQAKVQESMSSWLAARRRVAAPRRVSHTMLGSYMARSYWLEASEGSGQMTAEVGADNSVEITSKGIKAIRLALDDRLFDLTRPVRVTWNGRALAPLNASSSHEAIALSWLGREDPALCTKAMAVLRLGGAAEASAPRAPKRRAPSAPRPRARLY